MCTSGTSLDTIRLARPSRMAVFPTPGGPMRTGFDFVRRERTGIFNVSGDTCSLVNEARTLNGTTNF